MIKFVKKLFDNLRYGQKIAENCYLDVISKDELVVTYGNRKVKISMERLKGKPDRVIYSDKLKSWLPPHENDPLSEELYQFILNMIVKHFEEIGEEVECK